jgi:hypothetical protein
MRVLMPSAFSELAAQAEQKIGETLGFKFEFWKVIWPRRLLFDVT